MTHEEFIEQIASYVKKYAPDFGICVYSPIIAQACLESGYGTSNKVYKDGEWRHNYFGLKWRDGRCAISNDYFSEWTAEQDAKTGQYTNKEARFCKFKNMEEGVIGYFQWTNISNYANLKGVTDPETYLRNIKADQYATSIHYVENNMRVIQDNNLTRFDPDPSVTPTKGNTMKINIHAGHNPDGRVACGAIGLIKESTENRKVKDEVISMLRALGHTVYDCTVDDGKSKNDVLAKIVAKCNAHTVDLDVSIHFNSGAKDKSGNGKSTGTEVLICKSGSKAAPYAQSVAKAISDLGFKNRGVKVNSSLYVLKNTKAPAMLIESCFVDDADDVKLYNTSKMAQAIVLGITGQSVAPTVPEHPTPTPESAKPTTPSNVVGSKSDCPFIIECLDDLNIRQTPGGTIVKPNGCKKGIKYTIIDVQDTWGRLKSGAGWITIKSKYVKRG